VTAADGGRRRPFRGLVRLPGGSLADAPVWTVCARERPAGGVEVSEPAEPAVQARTLETHAHSQRCDGDADGDGREHEHGQERLERQHAQRTPRHRIGALDGQFALVAREDLAEGAGYGELVARLRIEDIRITMPGPIQPPMPRSPAPGSTDTF
jgi:hypothetical protein